MTVFALMPTLPGREEMRQKAIDSIHRQSYPNSWDVVLLMDADPDLTLGAKLNKMLDSISNLPADHIILVDDDDLHHPTRVARQIRPLIDNPNLLMTGTSVIVFRDTRNNEVWRYTGTSDMWIGGLAFTAGAWKAHRFEDLGAGCDTRWQKQFSSQARLDLQDDSLMLCAIHANNTSTKYTVGQQWQRLPAVPESLMGL
jgi:glycosyltransferase involved in cell wall biosynthesis